MAKTIWKDKGYDVHYILAALAGKLGQNNISVEPDSPDLEVRFGPLANAKKHPLW